MRNQYVGKNITELQATIDSVNHKVDSVGAIYADALKRISYLNIPYQEYVKNPDGSGEFQRPKPVELDRPLNVDSIFKGGNPAFAKSVINQGLSKARRAYNDYDFKAETMHDDKYTIRRHADRAVKKFTLSAACLVFFLSALPLARLSAKGAWNSSCHLGHPVYILLYNR